MTLQKYTVARFTITGPVLPSIIETIYVSEIARRYLSGIYGKLFHGESSAVISGKMKDGAPMKGHRHAFFLPTDENADGDIDHITIYAREGFGEKEIRAIDSFRNMHGPSGSQLRLMLVGLGDTVDFKSVPLFSESKIWRSATPFIPTRHYKKRGKKRDTCSLDDFPSVTLAEEMSRRNLPEPRKVTRLPVCEINRGSGKRISWLRFRRERVMGKGRKGLNHGAGFELEFENTVKGPMAFGYGCHFGLGLFLSEMEST